MVVLLTFMILFFAPALIVAVDNGVAVAKCRVWEQNRACLNNEAQPHEARKLPFTGEARKRG